MLATTMARGTLATWYDREVLGRVLDIGMRGVDVLRPWLLAPAYGRVIEVGFGAGSNLPYYPPAVRELVAVEPSAGLASRAAQRLAAWDRPFQVLIQSGARPLPLDAASFDTAVITFVLCSVRHMPELLAETRRVLRPGGLLIVAEHVAAAGGIQRLAQKLLRPVWWTCVGGCDPTNQPVPALRAAGFDVSALQHTRLRLPWPVSPGLVGTARAI